MYFSEAKGGPHLALKLADFNLATEVHGEFLKKCCGTPGEERDWGMG